MRVIGGTHRSRQLVAPRGAATRPTSDRLRETLFNILSPRIESANFADLYAGTGAVGIEALSRGARHVWFAEKAEPAITAIRANLSALKIPSGYTLEDRGTGRLLERLIKAAQKATANDAPTARPPQQFDLVFLDPPWEAATEYSATLNLLGSSQGSVLLAPNALVIAEHGSKSPLASHYGSLTQTRTLKQGDAALSFYTKSHNIDQNSEASF